jgi:hypothetical protein
MLTLKATSLWLLYSLGVTVLAQPDSGGTGLKRLTLSNNNEGSKILNRQASDDCFGDCETCFGAGFQLCASSSSICYLPGDALYGEESCSGTDAIDTSSTDSSFPTEDTCDNGGLSCAYCFGEGHVSCPQSDMYCYDPNNSTTSCPGDTGTGTGTGFESTAIDGASSSTATGFADDSESTFTSSPTTDSETSTASASEASSTDAAGGAAGGSDGDTDTSSSATSTRSSSSSTATGGGNGNSNGDQGTSGSNSNNNQGSTSGNDANGNPIKKSNGHSLAREGMFGGLVAGGVAFAATWYLRI